MHNEYIYVLHVFIGQIEVSEHQYDTFWFQSTVLLTADLFHIYF